MYSEFADQKLIFNVLLICRGVVVILHGLNEHWFVCYNTDYLMHFFMFFQLLLTSVHFFDSGRYGDFAKKLNAIGLKVYGMDWIGKWKTLDGKFV